MWVCILDKIFHTFSKLQPPASLIWQVWRTTRRVFETKYFCMFEIILKAWCRPQRWGIWCSVTAANISHMLGTKTNIVWISSQVWSKLIFDEAPYFKTWSKSILIFRPIMTCVLTFSIRTKTKDIYQIHHCDGFYFSLSLIMDWWKLVAAGKGLSGATIFVVFYQIFL